VESREGSDSIFGDVVIVVVVVVVVACDEDVEISSVRVRFTPDMFF
jgi:hypothetical protein